MTTAPSFAAIGTHIASSSGTASFPVPAGVTAGDIIVIPFYVDNGGSISVLATGFVHAEGSPLSITSGFGLHNLNIVWKRATAADAGTYDFTLSINTYRAGAAARYIDCISTGTPFDTPTGHAVDGSVSSTVTPAVSVTTSVDNTLLVFAGSNWSGGAWTPPAGFTERMDAGDRVHTLDDALMATAGTTGSVTATCAGSSGRTAWLGALLPEPPPVVVPPVTPVSTGGSWYTLLDIQREASDLYREYRDRPPLACPNDGEPLVSGSDGSLFCRFDGWRYPRDWVRGM